MKPLHMITFRCRQELFKRLERYSQRHRLDRTSVIKLAVHYLLNVASVRKRPQ